MLSIASVTPTICQLGKIGCNRGGRLEPVDSVLKEAQIRGISPVRKTLIYAPDALGLHLHDRYHALFEKVLVYAPIAVPVRSVFPPVTPVCFASMFSGVPPNVHGLEKYEKPVLRTETLFDMAISAGKRVSIAAVAGSSIDIIFRERKLDYYSEDYDAEVTGRTIELLRSDEHDMILAYHQEYDDMLHRSNPFSPEAVQAAENHIKSFGTIAAAFNRYWKMHDRVIVFAPDHGAHTDPVTGRGTHGLDIPEDMELMHYYGLYPGGM
jgi:hypothetical protein